MKNIVIIGLTLVILASTGCSSIPQPFNSLLEGSWIMEDKVVLNSSEVIDKLIVRSPYAVSKKQLLDVFLETHKRDLAREINHVNWEFTSEGEFIFKEDDILIASGIYSIPKSSQFVNLTVKKSNGYWNSAGFQVEIISDKVLKLNLLDLNGTHLQFTFKKKT